MIDLPTSDINPHTVIARVAARFGTTLEDVLGKDRQKHIAQARHVAMWALRQRKLSFPALGRLFGNRDHTTAMNAVRKVERQRAEDPAFRLELDRLLAGTGVSKVVQEPGSGVWVA